MEYLICSRCNGQIEGEVFFYEEHNFCENCFQEEFFHCKICNGLFFNNTSHVAIDANGFEQTICSSCLESYTYTCNNCSVSCFNEYPSIVVNEERVCNECRLEYYYCNHCGHYVRDEDWCDDQDCCNDCRDDEENYDDCIGSYHSTRFRYIGKEKSTWKGQWRGLGFELEIDRSSNEYGCNNKLAQALDDCAKERISFERDGSLKYGFEIITQPHTVKEFYEFDWGQILTLCKEHGFTSHDSTTCGLHIHVSRTMFGATEKLQNLAIAKVIYFYDKFWTELLKLSRRTQSQAEQWANNYCIKNRKEAMRIKKRNYSRYYAVNNCNANTVEFRLGRGTLVKESFYAWIDFNLTIVRNSKKVKWSNIDNINSWLKGIKEETKQYIKAKNIFNSWEELN